MFALNQRTTAALALPITILAAEALLIVAALDITVDMSIFEQPRSTLSTLAGPATVTVPIYEFDYRLSGVHVVDGDEADAGVETRSLKHELNITRDQVTEAEYLECVRAGACEQIVSRWPASGELRPITGASYEDAIRYADWLSLQTGHDWRLPTDEEWVAAAGTRARDDAIGTENPNGDPAARWLDAYAQQNEARSAGGPPHATGFFGANEFGLNDLSGNVWEWTNTCFSRTRFTAGGGLLSVVDTCAVRVVQGLHRTYISTFIRDAKAGGCSVGAPPNHLGFRLVREPDSDPIERLTDWLQNKFDNLLMRA